MKLKVKNKLGKVNDKNKTLRQGRRLKKTPKNFLWEAEHESDDLISSSPDYVLALITKNYLLNGSPNIFFRPQFFTSFTVLFTAISFNDWIVIYPSRRVIPLLQHRSWARLCKHCGSKLQTYVLRLLWFLTCDPRAPRRPGFPVAPSCPYNHKYSR